MLSIESLKQLIEKYKLSEKEHNIILNKLKKEYFSNKEKENNTEAMFVIGQPGCGKTTFIKNTNLSNYTIINSDDFRKLNKFSDEILAKYPTYYTKLTNYDAHLWGDELFSYGLKNGYSVLREKAPIDYTLIELIKKISSNHDLIINVVVTGNLSSLLATRERYEKEILKSKSARLSNIEAHNICYNLLPNFISQCIELGVKVNYIVPNNSAFEIINTGKDYLELLEKIRKESNEKTCINYESRINNIIKAMKERNAPKEQFDELNKIEKIYFDIVNNK